MTRRSSPGTALRVIGLPAVGGGAMLFLARDVIHTRRRLTRTMWAFGVLSGAWAGWP